MLTRALFSFGPSNLAALGLMDSAKPALQLAAPAEAAEAAADPEMVRCARGVPRVPLPFTPKALVRCE